MGKRGKSQIAGNPILALFFAAGFILIAIFGFKAYHYIKDSQCRAALVNLQSNVRSDFIELASRQGSVKQKSYVYGCDTDAIYFVDAAQNIPQDAFNRSAEIQNSLFGSTTDNLFILRKGKLFASFNIGQLSLSHPHYRCFNTTAIKKLDMLVQGEGNAVSIEHTENFKGSGYDCTDHELPEEIAVQPSIEKASNIIGNSADYLGRTFDLDQRQAIERFNETQERVEIDREFQVLEGGTKVKIKIRPKGRKVIDNFIYIEDIPKACLNYLTDYEIEAQGEVVSADPVIAWHFASIEGRQEASYFIPDVELKERCKDLIDGVGLAENFVDSIEKIENNPPILAVPNLVLTEDTKLVVDLSRYISDPDTNKKELIASIATPTNMQAIMNGFTLTLIPNPNWYGTETLYITTRDEAEATTQQITATVEAVNDAPVITSTPLTQIAQYQEYSYKVAASDTEQDPLSYSLVEYPVGMSIDADGVISWVPQVSGSFKIKVQVSDGSLSTAQEYTLDVQHVNKAPQFAALTAATLKGIVGSDNGFRDNVVANLWIFVADDSDTKKLEYSVSSQTNPNLVTCFVDGLKNLDCNVKNNYDGYSEVTLSVSDGQFNAYAVLRINIEKSLCIPNVLKKCEDSRVYWFDSCDIKGSLYYDCKKNWLRNQCRDAKCCIGNVFCQEPIQSCKDECKPEERQCSGSGGYRVCGDSNNDGCFEWGSVTSCGSDHCDEFGSWSCKDSKSRTRSRTCYKQGCANGNCDSALWQDTQTESCSSNRVCLAGNCIAACIPQTCSSLGRQCGSSPDGCGGTLNCGGCTSSQRCDNGKCVNAVASLSMEFININHQHSDGRHYIYHTRVIKEINGIGVTLTSGQLCIQNSGCNSASVNYRINANSQYVFDNYFWTRYSSDTFTLTYTGMDDNGNAVSVTQSFTH